MEKVCQFAVKVIIDRAEHMNKKKIVDALEKAITNLRSRDVTVVEVREIWDAIYNLEYMIFVKKL